MSLKLAPHGTLGAASAGMLSVDGRCKTLDARANGYARGEGVGALVLRAARAASAGAWCSCGSAVRQDGRSASLTAPNGSAQRTLLLAALGARARAAAGGGCASRRTARARRWATRPRRARSRRRASVVRSRAAPLAVGRGEGERRAQRGGVGAGGAAEGCALRASACGATRSCACSTRWWASAGACAAPALCALPTQLAAIDARTPVGGVSSFGYSGTIAHAVLPRGRRCRLLAARAGGPAAVPYRRRFRRCGACGTATVGRGRAAGAACTLRARSARAASPAACARRLLLGVSLRGAVMRCARGSRGRRQHAARVAAVAALLLGSGASRRRWRLMRAAARSALALAQLLLRPPRTRALAAADVRRARLGGGARGDARRGARRRVGLCARAAPRARRRCARRASTCRAARAALRHAAAGAPRACAGGGGGGGGGGDARARTRRGCARADGGRRRAIGALARRRVRDHGRARRARAARCGAARRAAAHRAWCCVAQRPCGARRAGPRGAAAVRSARARGVRCWRATAPPTREALRAGSALALPRGWRAARGGRAGRQGPAARDARARMRCDVCAEGVGAWHLRARVVRAPPLEASLVLFSSVGSGVWQRRAGQLRGGQRVPRRARARAVMRQRRSARSLQWPLVGGAGMGAAAFARGSEQLALQSMAWRASRSMYAFVRLRSSRPALAP